MCGDPNHLSNTCPFCGMEDALEQVVARLSLHATNFVDAPIVEEDFTIALNPIALIVD